MIRSASPLDTTLAASRVQFAVLTKLGKERRALMAFELSDNLREALETGVKSRHPDYDEKSIKLAVLRLMVGDRLYKHCLTAINQKL